MKINLHRISHIAAGPAVPQSPFPPGSDGYLLLQELWPYIKSGEVQSLEDIRKYVDAKDIDQYALHYTALDAVLSYLSEEHGIPET